MSPAGLLASILSILTVSGGITIQIRKIIVMRQADQFSVVWLLLGLVTWTGWAIYGISIADWYIIVPNVIGLLVQTALFFTVLRYRRQK